MTTADLRRSRIARLAGFPEELAAAVERLDDRALDARSGDDPWCIRQVVHHVADSHMNAFIRTKLILTENHPTLKAYDQDAWAALPDTAAMPLDASLAILRGLHARWVTILGSISEDDWRRSALHPENGEVTLDSILETYDRHCSEHLDQVKRIVAATQPAAR